MSRRQVDGRQLLFAALGVWLAACNLDSDLPGRKSSAAPADSGVTLSGAGALDELDAAVGYGEGSRITDINGKNKNDRASADGIAGGIDRGGAFDESAGDIGGATANGGGAAGAGDSAGGEAGAGGAVGSDAKPPPLLWFSEYVEGSSSNKALEITALTRTVLDGCKVATYFNGKSEAAVVASLSGTLEAGRVLTLCTSTLKEKLGSSCNQVGNLTFNGDDVVALGCDGKTLDVIGKIGEDPGTAWGSDANSTADHSLRRKCNVQSGDALGTDAFDPSTEWQAFPVDTFDGLGKRGC